MTDTRADRPAGERKPLDLASLWNNDCQCISVDSEQLVTELGAGLGDGVAKALLDASGTAFASFPVFVARQHIAAMQRLSEAVEAVVATEGYRRAVAMRTPSEIWRPELAAPALLSYDFHLADDGPRLIECNTNPGGVLWGLAITRAQRACCDAVEAAMDGGPGVGAVEERLLSSFRDAHQRLSAATGRDPRLRHVTIVDRQPQEQFLYPELLLYQDLFLRHGIDAAICDVAELDRQPDLVYNRHTDFYLREPESAILRRWWTDGAVAMTPDPVAYALYADKRNLPWLGDERQLREWGVLDEHVEVLRQQVPETFELSREAELHGRDTEGLWRGRRELFFKPSTGYGSRGAYDGGKLTRKTFEKLLGSDYVAQTKITPSERKLVIDGKPLRLKIDLRYVSYAGQSLIVLARLYRGQTTNLRTVGGGLATVFAV